MRPRQEDIGGRWREGGAGVDAGRARPGLETCHRGNDLLAKHLERSEFVDVGHVEDDVLHTDLAQKVAVLRGHCDAVGRNYAEIEKTALGTVNLTPGRTTPQQVIGQCRALLPDHIQASADEEIAGIGILRHQAQRPLLAPTPDQNRWVRLADGLGRLSGSVSW